MLLQSPLVRWNYIKTFKYKHRDAYPYLSLPEPLQIIEAKDRYDDTQRKKQRMIEHPHMAKWAAEGKKFFHPYHWQPESEAPRASEPVPSGHARVQVSDI